MCSMQCVPCVIVLCVVGGGVRGHVSAECLQLVMNMITVFIL